MPIRPGGYDSKVAREARAERIRALWSDGIAPSHIAQRLGISPTLVTQTATTLGLREPVARRPRKSLD